MSMYEKTAAKDIVADKDSIREIVSTTMRDVANIVGASLGPGGRPVLIERDPLSPLITKDGVTIARHLGVSESRRNIVIESAKEICLRTAREAGDGTTSAIVIANALVQHGFEYLDSALKINPQKFVREIQEAYEKVIIPYLKEKAVPADSVEKLQHVATISSNGDEVIAKKVVEAVMAAGEDGTVLIQEGAERETKVELINGMIICTGLKELGQIGPVFINDNANQQSKLVNGLSFLYNGSLSDLTPLGALQDAMNNTELAGIPIAIFAHEFSDQVKTTVAKHVKTGFAFVLVKVPVSGMANSRSEMLKDLAAYTNGEVYDAGNIDTLTGDGLGRFDLVKVNMFETVIECTPDPDKVEERVQQLKAVMSAAKSDYDRMHIRAAIG